MKTKPIAYDLCCGDGGWAKGLIAAGWRVIGYDIDPRPSYPGEFRLGDVRELDGRDLADGHLIVASPPCEQFSRHGMPWTRARNPPPPDLSIAEACWRIAREAGLPIILENVRFAQPFLGKAKAHVGAFYLWGDVPPGRPYATRAQKKESFGSRERLKRAMIPDEVSAWIGQAFLPIECFACGYQFNATCGLFGCPNCHGEGVDDEGR